MNPYAYLIAAVVAVVMLAGSYLQGRKDGGNIVRADYAARDLKTATDYAAKEREITDAYRKKESQLAQSFAATGTKLQQERLKHAATKRDLDAALVAGSIVFTDPGNRPACGGQAAATTPGASGNNDHAGGKLQNEATGVLSREASTFLVALADDADTVATQLTACQQILRDERK